MDQLPKAKTGDSAPGFSTITDWSKFYGSNGINPYDSRYDTGASQSGLSKEDYIYRQYYGLPTNQAGYGQVAAGGIASPEKLENVNRQFMGAVQPVLDSLTASKKPLEDRYSAILDQIKGNQKTSENRQTVATANELSRRGIQGGGLWDQTIASAVNPITADYTNQYKETGFQRESDLNKIDQLIAQTSSGASTNAIQQAMKLMELQQNQNQFDKSNQLAQDELNKYKIPSLAGSSNTGALKDNFIAIGDGTVLWDVKNNQLVYNNQKDYKATGAGDDGSWF